MKRKNSTLTVILISLVIVTIGLGIFIFYNKIIKKSSIEQKLYHIEDGEKYNIYGKESDDREFVNRGIEISFSYPVIDINSSEIKKVNKLISKMYKENYKTNFETSAEFSCVAIKKNDKYYGGSHILFNSYKISENEKFLSIVIVSKAYTECAGGDISYDGFVIDKHTKKLLSNKEILKMFNAENDEKIFIDKYNEDAEIFENDKINNIEDAKILIYNNKLMISIVGNGESLLQYNNGKLEDYYD